ncbi:PP2C family protein-serine/threonine phosphatase [Cellulomonas fimi]|uniref:Protein serine/threonine phosphatase n=1 Tax=Cellulomonas fimi (strain ATCC 484 / DSM 20113 / JCM 1341 / CCUG 24087 / LMG 16345 / NBRC 15513 / NCIMB 8980 / NCTC 7547 / NRS-133) TaxID=590998 RepID=F4H2X0_CELFA|nr:protein phosphatase 2C domain-containing protein [Cellulomonas fimi]AEE46469.1 protein serine/threonine phosphatase [Cellulomonas fimi ATCC 484]NNH08223.1 serine/threonine-protein phosphatase [Cellulomonas fimi]VEH33129.1 Serine/threonine phosphatase stp [Cellulomonas fimi]
MRTSWGSATDRGRVREVNEDALLAYPPVFLVADGMGGHDAGDLASRIAVEEFAQLAGKLAATADDVHACFTRTAGRIRTEFTGGRRGGTTVSGVAVTEHEGGSYWLVFNVGDSRVYRWADDVLEQVSVDHSVVQELIDLGEITAGDAEHHPERHVLTRALGTGEAPEPDYWLLPAGLTDRLLICTDGLTRELGDDDIAALLRATADPQDAATLLVQHALGRGARDNVSAVVVDVATTGGAHDDVHITVPRLGADLGPHLWDEMLNGATVPRSPARPSPAPVPTDDAGGPPSTSSPSYARDQENPR